MHDKYQEFVTDSQREELSAKLQEVEDWLYEDGEDETKGVYIAKLEELKKVSDILLQVSNQEENDVILITRNSVRFWCMVFVCILMLNIIAAR